MAIDAVRPSPTKAPNRTLCKRLIVVPPPSNIKSQSQIELMRTPTARLGSGCAEATDHFLVNTAATATRVPSVPGPLTIDRPTGKPSTSAPGMLTCGTPVSPPRAHTHNSAPPRSRATRHAPVDHQFRAGHVAGCVRGEEQHLRYPAPVQPCRAALRLWPPRSDQLACCRPADTGSFVQIGVSMTPGWTVLTRIPSDSTAHSIATALANRRTPPFVAR